MAKISKDYYVNSETLNIITKNLYENILIAKEMSTSKIHKITISYEIDREVTIKESDIDRLFPPEAGFFNRDLQIIKQKLFGGGENE